MLEADYTLTDSAFSAARGNMNAGDELLLVKFYYEPKLDHDKTETEGRPIYKDVVFIDIRQPGNRDGGIVRPATKDDVNRFPVHYQKFMSRQDQQAVEGTILSAWPGVTRSQVEELKFFNITTVEQLANLSDSNTGNIMGLVTLKQKAKAYLEASKGNATAEALVAANKRIDELTAMVERLMDGAPVEKAKRRGRPPKEE
jgi:hypothetical protein